MSLKNGFADENADPNALGGSRKEGSKVLESQSKLSAAAIEPPKPPSGVLRAPSKVPEETAAPPNEQVNISPPTPPLEEVHPVEEAEPGATAEESDPQDEEELEPPKEEESVAPFGESQMYRSGFPPIRPENYFLTLVKFVNSFRRAMGRAELFPDIGLSMVIQEYFLMEESTAINQRVLGLIAKKFKAPTDFEMVGITFEAFDEELCSFQEFEGCLHQAFSVLMESEEDAERLLSPDFNCLGCSLKVEDQTVSVLILLATTSIEIQKVELIPATRIDVVGRVIGQNAGPFFLKVNTLDKKDPLLVVNPQNMTFDAATGQFTISTDQIDLFEAPLKLAELYLRHEPENIKYGAKSTLSHVPRNMEIAIAFPLIEFPFKVTEIRKMRSVFGTLGLSRKPTRLGNPPEQGPEGAPLEFYNLEDDTEHQDHNDSESSNEEQDSQDKSKVSHSLEYDDNKKIVPTGRDPESIAEFELNNFPATAPVEPSKNEDALKSELESTLEEAMAELKKQTTKNISMQVQIGQLMKEKKERDAKGAFACSEFNTNEIKYVNSIALISEIRKELRTIKGKYSQATQLMNEKLEEKTAKFKGIQESFRTLKREICRNAIFESNNKRIPQRLLDETEAREEDTAATLQLTRLEIIKMRRLIEKHTQTLARKEELADGLHLIDFEKLKIENQSLNEKIEERNEEIFKLVNKNVLSIHILAHLKEKLFWEQGQMEKLVTRYDAIGELIRQRLQGSEGTTLHRRKHPQGIQKNDVQANPGNRNRQKQVPETRFY